VRDGGRAAAAVFAVLLVASAAARGHGSEEHGDPADPAQVLAPGYGKLGFTPPAAGSYALPSLGPAEDGRVLAADGSATTLHAVFGDELVLLSFVYASCPDVNGCPLATAVLHRVQRRLAAEPEIAERLRLVSLSFDPERDTPAVMRRYGESFRGGGVDWRFLTTASEHELRPILDGYGQSSAEEVGPDGRSTGRIAHIMRVFLIDAHQRIRNSYTVSFLHPDTLVNDLRTVLAERAPGSPTSVDAKPQAVLSPGDPREGYDRRDWRTHSTALAARHGRAADLIARARRRPLGLPETPEPTSDPLTPEKVALGRKLFFDRRLASNDTLSCALCHLPEQGFTNNEIATAVGIEGRTVRRNAPTLLDAAHVKRLFHDGRAPSLEEQVWGPLLARNEMGNASRESLVAELRAMPDYAGRFDAAFPDDGLTPATIGRALASYERTLVTGDSAFDRWHFGGDEDAIDSAARRGFELFRGKAGCTSCHTVARDFALFSDGDFHNTGVGAATAAAPSDTRRVQIAPGDWIEVDRAIIAAVSEPVANDSGRFEITGDPSDRGRFRTPTLRNVALTAPYMHDGSLASLHEVVRFYDQGGIPNPNLDPRIRPLGLAAREIADLVAFLGSLTGGDIDTLVSDAFAAPIGDAD
jgi:cytochrome c peroxidase